MINRKCDFVIVVQFALTEQNSDCLTDLQPLRDGALSEAAESGECGVVLVEAHGDVEAVALLLLLQADGERATHSVAQPLALQ